MFKIVLYAALVACCFLSKVSAETHAFGLILGKSTVQDLKSTFPTARFSVTSIFTHGPVYKISGTAVDFDGTRDMGFVFTEEGKLTAITMTVDKSRFDDLSHILMKKYVAIETKLPRAGTKMIQYESGQDLITLTAVPRMRHLILHYTEKRYLKLLARELPLLRDKQLEREGKQF